MPNSNLMVTGSNPDRGTQQEIFIYIFISPTTFGAWYQDDYRTSPRAKLCLRSQKEPGNNIWYKCSIVAWRSVVVRLAKYK